MNQVQDAQPPPTEDARTGDTGHIRVCDFDSHSDDSSRSLFSAWFKARLIVFFFSQFLGTRRLEIYMMKFKPNQTRTYDGEGFKRRAACLCFRNDKEDEVLLVSSSRHPDQWIVPGGGMEPEEEPCGAAVREVYEELNRDRTGMTLCPFSDAASGREECATRRTDQIQTGCVSTLVQNKPFTCLFKAFNFKTSCVLCFNL